LRNSLEANASGLKTFMRACALLILISTLFATTDNSAMHLSLHITEGERSKDSHSTTTIITLNGNQLLYNQFYSGFRAINRKPVRKKIDLSEEEISGLRVVINRTALLTSNIIKHSANEYGRYTNVILKIALGKHRSVITISGMTKEMESEKLYQEVKTLQEEIERIVDSR
jgi:hypothetical protein